MSPYSESFRKLRASIDMGAEFDGILRDEALVVLVCSALQAEGKTTSAISLARTYALSGANTLLIDADLRKPNVERTTGCRSEVGFLDYLMAWGTPEG
jgi:polysaccharide biosynthesis transport protein